ncbi:hypothetical protein PVAP13_6KG228400 [Panicum virgatum]|uniref:GRF-type domain-containing protein n=1 Tax=Panicum virgatum TaxID=38727 RepID=A0A8T0REX6_PANVG|nr:hypothetical protein PVAP13_6KG228400 [Panicum virgatum]
MSRGSSGRSSSSHGGHEWPSYGAVPLIRCPECQRSELVRLTTRRWENGNLGREFVKCESNSQKALKSCNFSMWLEEYIKKRKKQICGCQLGHVCCRTEEHECQS